MSAVRCAMTVKSYQGDEPFFFNQDEALAERYGKRTPAEKAGIEYIIDVTSEDTNINTQVTSSSLFYQSIRAITTILAIGFLVLLCLSLFSVVSLHWSIAAVGSLGSVGLAGAVWFSKPLFSIQNRQ